MDARLLGVLWVVAALGCGPAVAEPDTSGGGDGSGMGSSGGTSAADETGEASLDCPYVVAAASVGAMSPVIADGFGYWSQLDGTVWRVGLGEEIGAPEQVAAGVGPYTGLLIDEGRVLLVEGEALSWHSLTDGTTTLLADGQSSPLSPALWNGEVLWLNYGSGILSGSMMRTQADAPATEPTMVLDNVGFPRSLAADASSAYVLADQVPDFISGALLEVDPLTGATVVRAADMDHPGEIAVTSDRIVWVEQGIQGPGRVRVLGKTDEGSPSTLAMVEDGMPITVAADDEAIYYGVFGTSEASLMQLDLASESGPTLVQTWPTAVLDVAVSPTHVLVTANPADSAVGPVDSVTVFCRE